MHTTELAFANDPIVQYLREPARRGPVQRIAARWSMHLKWLQATAHKWAWTVDHGDSVLIMYACWDLAH